MRSGQSTPLLSLAPFMLDWLYRSDGLTTRRIPATEEEPWLSTIP